jgi:hypothetical protein
MTELPIGDCQLPIGAEWGATVIVIKIRSDISCQSAIGAEWGATVIVIKIRSDISCQSAIGNWQFNLGERE